ncbi:hypothetical protein OO012_01140 [Rhodobacteraceae bacterium KMM 6894]|nr:hypothetical protein [Rhodobacteraceae bacterium KMM 6894]
MAVNIKQFVPAVGRVSASDFHAPTWATHLGSAFVRSGVATTRGLSALVRSFQLSQMIKVLHYMTDQQLAELGVERAEIPAHAKRILAEQPAKG